MKIIYYTVIIAVLIFYGFLSVKDPANAVMLILPVILAAVVTSDEFKKEK